MNLTNKICNEKNARSESTWWKGIVKVIIILFSPIMIIWVVMTVDQSDTFQRVTNPQKYWCIRVAMLEQKIYKTESFIREWRNDRDEGFLIDYNEVVRGLIIEGKDPEEAKRIASEMVRSSTDAETEANQAVNKIRPELIQKSYKLIAQYESELQQAKKELSKYQ